MALRKPAAVPPMLERQIHWSHCDRAGRRKQIQAKMKRPPEDAVTVAHTGEREQTGVPSMIPISGKCRQSVSRPRRRNLTGCLNEASRKPAARPPRTPPGAPSAAARCPASSQQSRRRGRLNDAPGECPG